MASVTLTIRGTVSIWDHSTANNAEAQISQQVRHSARVCTKVCVHLGSRQTHTSWRKASARLYCGSACTRRRMSRTSSCPPSAGRCRAAAFFVVNSFICAPARSFC